MITRTFTVLLTITDSQEPVAGELERTIALHLETGIHLIGLPYSSAQVDVIPGDQMRINDQTIAAINMHDNLRRD